MKKDTAIRTFLASLLLSLLLMLFFGKMIFPVKALDFFVSFEPSIRGVTEIGFPPMGVISAETHLTPVKIKINLQNINFSLLKDLISEAPSSQELVVSVKNDLQRIVNVYIRRLLMLALLGGILGAIITNGKRVKPIIYGAVNGLTIAVIMIGITYLTYDPQEFRNPEYRGVLKSAPWVMKMAENALQSFDLFSEQLQVIAANIYQLYEGIQSQETLAENLNGLNVLLVSDIHNNAAANKFIQQIVENFSIDFVVDTGDLTDYGTPPESLLLKGLKDINRPYLFIPGNHDSPDIIKELSSYPQVRVLNDELVEIQGLKFLAWSDPSSLSNEINLSTSEIMQDFQKKMLKVWREASPKPHFIAVHNLQLVTSLIGQVPLIIHGHTHQVGITKERGTIIINAGTTGGAGLRGLQAMKEIPYSVILLHFRKDEEQDFSLYAADIIKIFNLEKGFVLERKYLYHTLESPLNLN